MSAVGDAEDTWLQPPTLPALPAGTIHIWRLRMADRLVSHDYVPYLQPEETVRAGNFLFPADQQQSIASRGTLRLLLAHYTGGGHPRDLELVRGERGKPALAHSDLRFNLSHTRNLALLAFAREIDLGIDLEEMDRACDIDAVVKQNFAPSERETLLALPPSERAEAFYRCWTRKEALLKAEGSGLFRALDSFAVSLLADQPARVITGAEGWDLEHIDVAQNAVGAIAWEHREPTPALVFLNCSQSIFSARN